jgi:membrane associated rhomboid family serine protease
MNGTSFTSVFTILIIAATVYISFLGFKNPLLVERYIFCPQYILRDKQYYRLVTSSFLHADWQHLAFNMFSLYAFGHMIEYIYGPLVFITIYFASIIGGDLLSLLVHRHHIYRAYGSSGGVCGIIFASIFLFPGGGISMFFVPVSIPAWLYAIVFLLGSFYGIKKSWGNIGHDAHLGGAIIGLVTATFLHPEIIGRSPKLYAAVMGLSIIILIYLIKNPMLLPLSSFTQSFPTFQSPTKPPLTREQEMRRVNVLLDKISKSGMQSLTREEHKFLLTASRKSKRNK